MFQERCSVASDVLMKGNWSSFGQVVGVIAAFFTIILSVLFLKDRYSPSEEFMSDQSNIPQVVISNELSDLESLLANQLNSSLRNHQCSDVELVSVEALGILTPSEQSTSGFTGFFLEGSAELRSRGKLLQIGIAGTGKGPAAQVNAISMASEKFMKRILTDSSFETYCVSQ